MNRFFKQNDGVKKLKAEHGVTAVEYGLIAALVAVAIMTTVGTLGTTLSGVFAKVTAALN
jgi:pilus assembly protein Flp/PilA